MHFLHIRWVLLMCHRRKPLLRVLAIEDSCGLFERAPLCLNDEEVAEEGFKDDPAEVDELEVFVYGRSAQRWDADGRCY